MADLYEHPKPSPSPSSSSSGNSGLPLDRDDFSIFLHNLLQGSSASSSSSSIAPSAQAPFMSSKAKLHLPPFASSPPPPPPPVFSSPVEAAPAAAAAVPPEDLRLRGRSADISDSTCLDRSGGFGYDSEGPEGIDVPLKPAPPRSSSKRSRAAEVHNLSEKRRRSKINEKMKALQMLIPNSNKTDKASMLDEAIEYLKQLQLQVQMLSMRNGLSLNSVYVPGVMQPVQLPQTGIGFEEENGLPTANRDFSANQGTSMHTFDIPNQCAPPNHSVAIPTITRVSNSEYSFGLEPSIPSHYGSFGPSTMSSKEVCREDTLPLLQLDMGIGGKNSS